MAESAAHENQLIGIAEYLRETLVQMDAAARELEARRAELAVRLAAMEASGDPVVIEAAADYEERLAEGRPYEGAEAVETLVTEAHRRYAP